MDHSGVVLSQADAKELFFLQINVCQKSFEEISDCLLWHLRSTQILASYCWTSRVMCWKLRPKHHYLWHLAQDLGGNQGLLNPRIYNCNDEESFLGKLKRVAKLTHGASVTQRTLQRYVLAMAKFFKDGADGAKARKA